MERPFIELWRCELEEHMRSNNDDKDTLLQIDHELSFRNRHIKKTAKLRNELSEAIKRLEIRQMNESSDICDENFVWPTTDAPMGDKGLFNVDWPEEGLLKHMGYRVGKRGKPLNQRRNLLCDIFEGSIPKFESSGYMDKWGSRNTSTRLRKMANSIASFVRNAKRCSQDRMAAVNKLRFNS